MTVVFSTHVMEQAEQLCEQLVMIHRGRVKLAGSLDAVRASEGRQAAHIRHRLNPGASLDGLPGVSAVSDHGNEAELTLEPDADTNALLTALLERGRITKFDVREPSLHEIFKRMAEGAA
jgi:ABC-2 type transport system ATP-binding protein